MTVVLQGKLSCQETSGTKGVIDAGGVEWMHVGGCVWHSGGPVGAARVILGRYRNVASEVRAPGSVNYLDVALKKGEKWRYEPPSGHTVAWAAVHEGELSATAIAVGELAVFEESDATIEFEAIENRGFIIGSAVRHPYSLVLGAYSVHTSRHALEKGEARIAKSANDIPSCVLDHP